jgi:hypothetical protein
MAEADDDAKDSGSKVSILETALTRMREAQADRDDVVVELRLAARGRLEILAKELQPLFAQLPEGNDQFEFALTDGENPRLWIDMTSFVRMGRDRRTYEFVKDTRLGRTILAEGTDRSEIVTRVANYAAERLLERERAIEGDWLAMRHHDFDTDRQHRSAKPLIVRTQSMEKPSRGWAPMLAVFLLGLLVGVVGLLAWAWFGTPPNY